MRRQHRSVLGATALCLLLAACGSRLSAEQREFVIAGARNDVPGGSNGGQPTQGPGATAGPSASAGPSAPTGNGTTGPTTGPVGPTGGPTNGPTQSTQDPTCSVPGGRGGATDRGVTAGEISIGNIADVSGPVPGLFESARQATTAFVAYWNATYGGVCGRRLKLVTYDSRTDANGHRSATLDACSSNFALVGSMSAFDSGGAKAGQDCNIPDISAAAVTVDHQRARNAYAASSTTVGVISSTRAGYPAQRFPEAVKKASFLYIGAGAAQANAEKDIEAYQKYGHGWNFVYTKAIDISTFNYKPYVQAMKDRDARFVQFLGAYQQAVRLAQAMKEQEFSPDMYLLDPTAYNSEFVRQGGDAVDGVYLYTDAGMFEEAGSNPEMQLYLRWLRHVAPNAVPTYFGIFAWSAARLFVTEAAKIGPNLTRQALIQRLRGLPEWTGNGIHSPQNVSGKLTSRCFMFMQLRGSTWRRVHPDRGYACNPLVNVNE